MDGIAKRWLSTRYVRLVGDQLINDGTFTLSIIVAGISNFTDGASYPLNARATFDRDNERNDLRELYSRLYEIRDAIERLDRRHSFANLD